MNILWESGRRWQFSAYSQHRAMRKPNPLLPHKEGEASTCEDSRVCDALIKKETAIKGRTGGSVANKAETGSAHRRAGVLKRAGGFRWGKESRWERAEHVSGIGLKAAGRVVGMKPGTRKQWKGLPVGDISRWKEVRTSGTKGYLGDLLIESRSYEVQKCTVKSPMVIRVLS